jgi:hypothetical protein
LTSPEGGRTPRTRSQRACSREDATQRYGRVLLARGHWPAYAMACVATKYVRMTGDNQAIILSGSLRASSAVERLRVPLHVEGEVAAAGVPGGT